MSHEAGFDRRGLMTRAALLTGLGAVPLPLAEAAAAETPISGNAFG